MTDEKKSLLRVLTGFTPVIDPKKCTKCMLCVTFCPENTIELKAGMPKVVYDNCTGCLICLRECPYTAIYEEKEL